MRSELHQHLASELRDIAFVPLDDRSFEAVKSVLKKSSGSEGRVVAALIESCPIDDLGDLLPNLARITMAVTHGRCYVAGALIEKFAVQQSDRWNRVPDHRESMIILLGTLLTPILDGISHDKDVRPFWSLNGLLEGLLKDPEIAKFDREAPFLFGAYRLLAGFQSGVLYECISQIQALTRTSRNPPREYITSRYEDCLRIAAKLDRAAFGKALNGPHSCLIFVVGTQYSASILANESPDDLNAELCEATTPFKVALISRHLEGPQASPDHRRLKDSTVTSLDLRLEDPATSFPLWVARFHCVKQYGPPSNGTATTALERVRAQLEPALHRPPSYGNCRVITELLWASLATDDAKRSWEHVIKYEPRLTQRPYLGTPREDLPVDFMARLQEFMRVRDGSLNRQELVDIESYLDSGENAPPIVTPERPRIDHACYSSRFFKLCVAGFHNIGALFCAEAFNICRLLFERDKTRFEPHTTKILAGIEMVLDRATKDEITAKILRSRVRLKDLRAAVANLENIDERATQTPFPVRGGLIALCYLTIVRPINVTDTWDRIEKTLGELPLLNISPPPLPLLVYQLASHSPSIAALRFGRIVEQHPHLAKFGTQLCPDFGSLDILIPMMRQGRPAVSRMAGSALACADLDVLSRVKLSEELLAGRHLGTLEEEFAAIGGIVDEVVAVELVRKAVESQDPAIRTGALVGAHRIFSVLERRERLYDA